MAHLDIDILRYKKLKGYELGLDRLGGTRGDSAGAYRKINMNDTSDPLWVERRTLTDLPPITQALHEGRTKKLEL